MDAVERRREAASLCRRPEQSPKGFEAKTLSFPEMEMTLRRGSLAQLWRALSFQDVFPGFSRVMQPSGGLALWAYRWRWRRRVLRAGGGAVASAVAFAVIAVTADTRVLAVQVALAVGAWSVSVWLPTQNNKHGEELSGPVAKAAGEAVSSENPTADTAMRRFNFIWVTSRLTCEGT